ncbi:MAG: phage holin family protein [Parafilimonas sp.]|nr:phage holin family protein [Parafilimonas sp.]
MNTDKLNTEETTADYFQDIKTKATQYVQQRLLLFRLQATEKISKIAATIITTVLLAVIGLFLLIFLSVTAALWIGESLGSNAAGFGIVTGFYLLVFLFVMFVLKKILQNSFINKLIRLFHKKD